MSPSACVLELGHGEFALWNRYFPRPYYVDAAGLEFLLALPIGRAMTYEERSFVEALRKADLTYNGGSDGAEKRFLLGLDRYLARLDQKEGRLSSSGAYSALHIVNTRCSLACPYCVSRVAHRATQSRLSSGSTDIDVVKGVVSQFLSRRVQASNAPVGVSFNGGEFLLEWPLLVAIVTDIA